MKSRSIEWTPARKFSRLCLSIAILAAVIVVASGMPGLAEAEVIEASPEVNAIEWAPPHSEAVPVRTENESEGPRVEPLTLSSPEPEIGDKRIALTFDDGPWPLHTQQVLDILEREQVKATFFMLGKQVRRYRDLARQVAAEGHLVGNHSLSHVYLRSATPELARSEIENAQEEIEKTLGVRPTWYRPAGGVVSPAVWAQTRESKVKLVLWTVDPKDYRCNSPVVLAQRVIETAHPGAIVLLHDGGGNRTTTVNALTTIIRELKAQGYTFVTLDEL